MRYFQQIIFKLLVIASGAYIQTSNAQSIEEFTINIDKSTLHLGANLKKLKYIKNDWTSKLDPFFPFIVEHKYVGNHPWKKKEFDISDIGFILDDSNRVITIILPIPYSFDALSYLTKKYGKITYSLGMNLGQLDENSPVMTKIWTRETYAVGLYDDPVRHVKIINITSTFSPKAGGKKRFRKDPSK